MRHPRRRRSWIEACRTAERIYARRLLRWVTGGMPLMWDYGTYSLTLVQVAVARSAHCLARVDSYVKLQPIWRLSDGFYLAHTHPSDRAFRRQGEHQLVPGLE